MKAGKKHIVIACAEGAISKEESLLSKKHYKLKVATREGHSVVYEIANKLSHYIDKEIRVSCAGHAQRGGQPCAYDREISTLFGIEGAKLIMNKDFGKLVVFVNHRFDAIPLEETAGKLKYVDVQGDTVKNAKLMGISFGDEMTLSK